MLVVYDSLTGNVQKFVNKLNVPTIRITEGLRVTEPFILITYTIGFGQVPNTVVNFLNDNSSNLIAVAGSGNMNWGAHFCGAVDIIAKKYNVPIILKFELSGTSKDVEKFMQEVKRIV